MKKISAFDWTVLGLCVIGYTLYVAGSTNVFRVYHDTRYGFSFQYPAWYTMTEHQVGEGAAARAEQTFFNSSWKQPVNGEGPVAITVGVYSNGSDLPVLDWIKNNDVSNFKLGDGALEAVSVAGKPAYRYHWDGLYPADEVVFSSGSGIYYFIVTYDSPSDPIRADFQVVLNTLQLK